MELAEPVKVNQVGARGASDVRGARGAARVFLGSRRGLLAIDGGWVIRLRCDMRTILSPREFAMQRRLLFLGFLGLILLAPAVRSAADDADPVIAKKKLSEW